MVDVVRSDARAPTHRAPKLSQLLRAREAGVFLALFALCLFRTFATDGFLTSLNLLNVGRQISLLGIMSVGMTFVLISGEVDLSVGSTYAFCGLSSGMLICLGWPLASAIAVGVLATFAGILSLAASARRQFSSAQWRHKVEVSMRPEITIVGSFAVGLTMRAPKLPVFGETMLGSDFDMGPGGKGSNQAVGTARLGAHSALVAMIGTDKLAGIATDLYAAEAIDTTYLTIRRERATGVGFIILNDKGENFIILDMGANELMDAAAVDAAEQRIAHSSVVMAVLEVPTIAAARAVELGRKHGVRTILNPAPARALPSEIFAHVDYLTPNESELRILLGRPADDPNSSRELAAELRRRGVRTVIVTLGRTGALILSDDLDVMIPAVPVDVVDTTGAGDAFNSGFAVALAEGRDVVDSVKFGVVCGGIACTKLGVVPSLPDRARADAVYAEAQNSIWRTQT